MVKSEKKMVVNAARLKKFREKNGLSLAALEGRIIELYEQELVPVKIGKTALHRFETGDRSIPRSQIQTIANAFGVDEEALIIEDFNYERELNLIMVSQGSELLEMSRACDKYISQLVDEPGDLACQNLILEAIDLLEGHHKYDVFTNSDKMKLGFKYREILDGLADKGYYVHANTSLQVAPFVADQVGSEEYILRFDLIDRHEDINANPEWSGRGLCKVLLIQFSCTEDTFVKRTHNINPANFDLSDDAFILESIERLKSGYTELGYAEFKAMELNQFLSSKARSIVELSAESIVTGTPEVGQPELIATSKEKLETNLILNKKDGNI